ncbi:MAG: LysM peptidoglycan-binding domain-containing protein, partial [Acidimicrobiales bacterium]
MTSVARVVKGLGALTLLAAVVVGIPWALWHFVGWPLPHHVPSAAQVGRALNHQGIPDQTLVDALAVAVWITWVTLVTSIAVEIPAALAGRRAPRLPLAGMFQPVTGRLVVAVIVAFLALAPRPDHPSTSGSSGSSPSAGALRRPIAALVLKGAVLTDATQSLPTTPTLAAAAAPQAAANGATAPAPPTNSPSIYVVQRGDTLWGIAERQLGNPLRWSEIYQLNEGRPQPGGVTLTDPHWIDPGWTLILPSIPAPAEAQPTASAPTASPTPTTAPDTTASPAPTPAPPLTTPAPAVAPSSTSPAAPHRADRPAEPVRLPSGSVVAGSFAAGVLSAVALGRLRRRHAYRYRPPQPGRNLTAEPLRPTLRHLTHPTDAESDDEVVSDPGTLPTVPFDDEERRQVPGHLEIGTREGAPVLVEMTDLSGLALCGPGSDDIARAVVAGLLVRAGPGAVEVLLTADLAERLLPGLRPDPAVRRAATIDNAARAVEAEIITRCRRLDSVGASDAATFRAANPENPLPLLVALLDDVPDTSLGRWSALVEGSARLGIAILFLGDSPAGTGRLVSDASRAVTDAEPTALAGRLTGVQLFGLRGDEAVELLGAVADSHDDEELDDGDAHDEEPDAEEPTTVLYPSNTSSRLAVQPAEPWPNQPHPDESAVRPIAVQMLGPLRITVHGEPISTGLRGRAKALFAWYLLRPEGATSDEAVEALWPDTDPDQVRRQFWRPFGDLRARFRSSGDGALDVLEKTGEHYRPHPAEIS